APARVAARPVRGLLRPAGRAGDRPRRSGRARRPRHRGRGGGPRRLGVAARAAHLPGARARGAAVLDRVQRVRHHRHGDGGAPPLPALGRVLPAGGERRGRVRADEPRAAGGRGDRRCRAGRLLRARHRAPQPRLARAAGVLRGPGDERSAESWFRAALARAPRAFDPRLNLANSLVRQGRLAEAEPEYRQAIALAPDDPLVRANYAVLLGGLGRREEARAQLRLAATLPPSAPAAAVAVVTILRALGLPGAARAAQTVAERRFPDDPGVRRTRAELERGAGGWGAARFSLCWRWGWGRTGAQRVLQRSVWRLR